MTKAKNYISPMEKKLRLESFDDVSLPSDSESVSINELASSCSENVVVSLTPKQPEINADLKGISPH